MVKNNYFVHFVVSMVLTVLLIGVIFMQSATSTGFVIEDDVAEGSSKDKAEIFGVLDRWIEDKEDTSKYLFNLHVYNFGSSEAKNVEVVCEVYASDQEGNVLDETPAVFVGKNIGDVAPNSFEVVELEAIKNIQKEGNSPAAICGINSCENCEIILDRISN